MNFVRINHKYLPLMVTCSLLIALIITGGTLYRGFLAPQVFLNLLIDNAFLCISAIGMTFVILTGGIDLSVGAVIALITLLSADLVEYHHVHPLIVMPLMLLLGTLFGIFQGTLITLFRLQPFIVTLAGMFLARGLCYLVSTESINITHPFYVAIAQMRIPVGMHASLSIGALIAVCSVIIAIWIAHATQFGRTVYAVGGNENSAMMMGLSVRSTLIGVYALSGFCAALAGIVMTFYMLSGYALHAVGLELDAIAVVVIGGTLLTGGIGYVAGTFLGVLILGTILTLITFDGTLSSWWTRIVIGVLLLIFCLLQRLFESRSR